MGLLKSFRKIYIKTVQISVNAPKHPKRKQQLFFFFLLYNPQNQYAEFGCRVRLPVSFYIEFAKLYKIKEAGFRPQKLTVKI